MEKARNRIRIRVANIMMVLTAIGCVFVVISGKKAAERGETVQKQNLDWHKEYNQRSTEEAIAAQKKWASEPNLSPNKASLKREIQFRKLCVIKVEEICRIF